MDAAGMGHPTLHGVGYFISEPGGAPRPAVIAKGLFVVELLTVGRVLDPLDDAPRGGGWIYCHGHGEETVWRSPKGEHYECLTITFRGEARDFDSWPRRFCWGKAQEAVDFAHEVTHAFHHRAIDRQVHGAMLWHHLRYRLALATSVAAAQDLPPEIALVVRHIERQFAEDIDIDQLAGLARLSTSHLHARFKDCVGQTPHQFLTQQRMRVARHLLVTTLDPIKEIAAAVGYASPEHFCRSFRRHCQTTAAAYRQAYAVRL